MAATLTIRTSRGEKSPVELTGKVTLFLNPRSVRIEGSDPQLMSLARKNVRSFHLTGFQGEVGLGNPKTRKRTGVDSWFVYPPKNVKVIIRGEKKSKDPLANVPPGERILVGN